jgi:pyruvate kinase
MAMKKARIVCTIGPASGSRKALYGLISGGMDVARLNFSHGDHQGHGRAMEAIRGGAKKNGRPVAILQDLQGIKIRTGPMEGGSVRLRRGRELLVAPGAASGTEEKIYVSYPHIIGDASVGDRILLDDGLMELRVLGKKGAALRTRVIEGGMLKDRKGVNLPGMDLRTQSFTRKDREDLAFGLEMGVDYVAVSFVRSASDLRKVRSYMTRSGRSAPIIAKIEKPEAVENIDEILSEADGIMVARGDLGVEMSPEDVPLIQKMLIDRANTAGKLVITATQMLESMTEHARPTRAEVTDVANAVIDGSDALMLSAETSVGKNPIKALRMMSRIIVTTEADVPSFPMYRNEGTFSEAIAVAATDAAQDIGARHIVAFTQSGYTARLLSKFRPSVPIIAFTPHEEARRRMSLYWGVQPRIMRPLKSTDSVFREVEKALLRDRLAKKGDRIVITASTPIGVAGKTNLLKLHRIGSIAST